MKITTDTRVSIIGVGKIGSSILQAFAQSEHKNFIGIDTSQESLDRAIKNIKDNLSKLVERKKIDQARMDEILGKIKTSTNLQDAKDSEVIIESIYEDPEIKKNFYREICKIVSKDCLILTNTSAISITDLASAVENPSRFGGMHFFNPVPVRKLVEIIKGLQTSDETIQAIKDLGAILGLTPAFCKDTPGFIVARLLNALLYEAITLLEEGIATPKDIDTAVRLGLGHPMGPLELFDYLNAIPLVCHVYEYMEKEIDPKWKPPRLLRSMVRAGWHGRDSGRGFYDYTKSER
jgi:3-hydroxybutyryl-CoA dehydrogenase